MRIYIASNFANKAAVDRASRTLERAGHTIMQTWTMENSKTPVSVAAYRDLSELNDAELLLILNLPGCEPPGRGTLFEAGYAHASGIPVVLAGKRVGLTFLELPHIIKFSTLKAALKWLRDIKSVDDLIRIPHTTFSPRL